MEPLLDIQDLKVRFKVKGGYVHAVNGVSLKLDEGEALGVVGESGCGKSVSMMSVMRLIDMPPGEITSGQVMYGGRDLLKIPIPEMRKVRGKEIGMVFQDPMTSLNPVHKIGSQIMEVLLLHMAMNKQQARARAAELLGMVGIPRAAERLDDYPHQFSGGMRQRVMIAMALACAPSILIADEPTTALDVTIQAQIVELALKMREQMGMAMIWITHDLGVVAGLADRVIVMYAGFVVEEARVDDVYDDPRHPYTLALLTALPRADRRRDHRLKSIPGAPPSLLVEPHGCPFAPRCEFVVERCWTENPALSAVGPGHRIACWVDVRTGAPR